MQPVWFLGAKSSCTLVKTPDVNVLIDPGIAAMQPSFPASVAKKREWHEEGRKAIVRAMAELATGQKIPRFPNSVLARLR